MALSSTTIATAIAALSVSGVTIKDITSVPDSITVRDCPILYPSPAQWMAGGTAEPGTGSTTFGTPSTRSWTFNRTYKYVYLHAPAGSGRSIAEHYSGLTSKADSIFEALVTLDVSGVDVMAVTMGEYGVLNDPSETNKYFGFLVDITLRERINA